MINHNGALDNSLDFDPNADYLKEVQGEGEDAAVEASGEIPAVDPVFEAATIASVAEATDPSPDPVVEAQIAELNAELGVAVTGGENLAEAAAADALVDTGLLEVADGLENTVKTVTEDIVEPSHAADTENPVTVTRAGLVEAAVVGAVAVAGVENAIEGGLEKETVEQELRESLSIGNLKSGGLEQAEDLIGRAQKAGIEIDTAGIIADAISESLKSYGGGFEKTIPVIVGLAEKFKIPRPDLGPLVQKELDDRAKRGTNPENLNELLGFAKESGIAFNTEGLSQGISKFAENMLYYDEIQVDKFLGAMKWAKQNELVVDLGSLVEKRRQELLSATPDALRTKNDIAKMIIDLNHLASASK